MDRHELTLHHPHRDVTILCGTRRAAISARLVRAYLPAALSSPALLNRRNQLDLDDYITSCAPVRHVMLRPGKMQRICQEFVDILADASDASDSSVAAADSVSAALTDALARVQLEDRRTAGRGGTGHRGGGNTDNSIGNVRYPRTLSAFLALADLSRTFGSRRIGAVLSSFFARHGERIVGTTDLSSSDDEEGVDVDLDGYYDRYDRYGGGGGGGHRDEEQEHAHAVLLWAWSLTVARMDADRRACLRDLLRARPDVLLSGRYDGFAAAALPDGDAEELWAAVERATEREGRGVRPPPPPPPPLGWQQRRGFDGFFEGGGRKREKDLQERRRAAALSLSDDAAAMAGAAGGGGGVYMHERRERRVVRSSGIDGGDRRPLPPLGLETYNHRAHRPVDPPGDRVNDWRPRPRGYGVGVVGGAERLRGTLDSIRTDQRELRLDVHDVKDELDELVEQVNKLGRRNGTRLRKGRTDWRDRDLVDCCCERLPEEHECEWVAEWWDDSY